MPHYITFYSTDLSPLLVKLQVHLLRFVLFSSLLAVCYCHSFFFSFPILSLDFVLPWTVNITKTWLESTVILTNSGWLLKNFVIIRASLNVTLHRATLYGAWWLWIQQVKQRRTRLVNVFRMQFVKSPWNSRFVLWLPGFARPDINVTHYFANRHEYFANKFPGRLYSQFLAYQLLAHVVSRQTLFGLCCPQRPFKLLVVLSIIAFNIWSIRSFFQII